MKAIYPWQQSQWQHLLTQQQSRRLPQALLFSGQRGLGKKDFALALAELVLCETGSEIACGICHSCQLFRAGSHPDFFMVYPEEEGKTIKVDQIRDLTASLNQTAQLNGYQVAVICPAEAMNVAAANALLKTLEEPPGPVLIILISHHLGGLPITIVSRCQKIAFFATDYAKTLNWLAPQVSGGEEQAQRLLKMANGAPLLALELASVNYLSLRDALLQHLVAMQQEQKNPIQGVDAFLKADLRLVLQIWFFIAMDLLRLQLNMMTQYIINEDKLVQLQAMSKKISRQRLLSFTERLQSAWQLTQNAVPVNLNLLVEGLFLSFIAV